VLRDTTRKTLGIKFFFPNRSDLNAFARKHNGICHLHKGSIAVHGCKKISSSDLFNVIFYLNRIFEKPYVKQMFIRANWIKCCKRQCTFVSRVTVSWFHKSLIWKQVFKEDVDFLRSLFFITPTLTFLSWNLAKSRQFLRQRLSCTDTVASNIEVKWRKKRQHFRAWRCIYLYIYTAF